jgi:hypothetical protein
MRPRVKKIPGYQRGSMDGLPGNLRTELEKIERAQPNTDTVLIDEDYDLKLGTRIILVDTSAGAINIALGPASRRFALPITVVKLTADENVVNVLPATDELISGAAALQLDDQYIAYSFHPDGISNWWLEGVHEEVVRITPGQIVKVIVNKHGKVIGSGGPITELDIEFSDIETLNASELMHGLLPKLSGDPDEFLNGVGEWAVPAGGGGGGGGGDIDGGHADSIYGGTTPIDGGGA